MGRCAGVGWDRRGPPAPFPAETNTRLHGFHKRLALSAWTRCVSLAAANFIWVTAS